MASLAQDEFDIFAAEQLRRTIACAPWRDVVRRPAQNEQVALHLGQVEHMARNLIMMSVSVFRNGRNGALVHPIIAISW